DSPGPPTRTPAKARSADASLRRRVEPGGHRYRRAFPASFDDERLSDDIKKVAVVSPGAWTSSVGYGSALSGVSSWRLFGDEVLVRFGRRDLDDQDHLGDVVIS